MAGAGLAEPPAYLLSYIGHASLAIVFQSFINFSRVLFLMARANQKKENKMVQVSWYQVQRVRVWTFQKGNWCGATARNSTYEEDSKGVREALHHQLIILEVVIANVQHFVRVEVRRDKDREDEANHDVSSRQMQQARSQSDA